jgi:hypothetical protein
MSANVTVGSNIVFTSSATVPRHSFRLAKLSASVVSRLNHQAGWTAASTAVAGVSAGGTVSPLRTSRIRAPPTGVSTVSSSAS